MALRRKYTWILSEQYLKKNWIWKRQVMIDYKFIFIQDTRVLEINRWLKETYILEWMTTAKKKESMLQKDTHKETAPSNYRPKNESI